MISQAAPWRRIARFRKDVDTAITRVVESRTYVLGDAVERFEQDFTAYCGMAHCVGVASGTDALALALRALGVGTNDEVITTALTAPATAQAIRHCGAIPRFIDVDPHTRCIDSGAVTAAITERTKAIVPVHLFGFPCDMFALLALAEQHQLVVVEDCAQAHGATLNGRKLGTFGHAAAFSFYPTKNLGGIGDGGAVVTNDVALAGELRSLRNYGYGGSDRISRQLGFNSRLDEIQAAILAALLPHLDASNAERCAIAAQYRECLAGGSFGLPPENIGCVYHQFAVTSVDRDAVMRHLARHDIGTAVHYSPGLHHHPAFAQAETISLPETDRLAASLLSLPIQPEVSADCIEQISRAMHDFEAQCVP